MRNEKHECRLSAGERKVKMKRKWLILAAACTAAVAVLAGCTGKSAAKESAASDGDDGVIPISDGSELDDVVPAPEEGDDVDQGREGRPGDSWNQDAPDTRAEEAEEAEQTEETGEAEDAAEEDEDAAEFAVTDDTDHEASKKAD